MPDKQAILDGRKAVDTYRSKHLNLYKKGWYESIHGDHTPLLEEMLAILKTQGFNSLNEFFAASEEINMIELGFVGKEDFEYRATDADYEALNGLWH